MRPTCLWWLLLLFHAVAEAAELPEPGVLRAWIKDMKSSARGPFAAIRWFCQVLQGWPVLPDNTCC